MEEKRKKKIAQIEHSLEQLYTDTGKEFLELSEKQQQKIDKLVDELILLKRELDKLEKNITCPNCFIHNTSDSHFCKKCGTPLQHKGEKKNERQ